MTQKQIGSTTSSPYLNVPTRWLSTFNTIRNAANARTILNSIAAKVFDWHVLAIAKEVWEHSVTVCTFLESAASLMKCRSCSLCETLSMKTKALKAVISKHKSVIYSSGAFHVSIAQEKDCKTQSMNRYFAINWHKALTYAIHDAILIFFLTLNTDSSQFGNFRFKIGVK